MPDISRFSVLEVLRAHLPAAVVIYAATRLLGFAPQEYIDYSARKAYLDSQFAAFFDDMFKLPPSAWASYGYLGKILNRVDQGILTRQEAQAEITGFFIAAQETTSSATSWGLMHLAKNPDLFQEVRQEIQTVLKDRPFESKDMNILPLTMSVLYEVIRMYPPAENLLRQTTTAYTIANTTIPAGAMVLLSLTEAFRDPCIFVEPDVFNPRRFESKDLRDLVRLAWAVGDVHVCKGMLLSMAELCAVIVAVCRQTTALTMEGSIPPANHGGSQHPDSAKGSRWYATWQAN
jgi:cytochrome P450